MTAAPWETEAEAEAVAPWEAAAAAPWETEGGASVPASRLVGSLAPPADEGSDWLGVGDEVRGFGRALERGGRQFAQSWDVNAIRRFNAIPDEIKKAEEEFSFADSYLTGQRKHPGMELQGFVTAGDEMDYKRAMQRTRNDAVRRKLELEQDYARLKVAAPRAAADFARQAEKIEALPQTQAQQEFHKEETPWWHFFKNPVELSALTLAESAPVMAQTMAAAPAGPVGVAAMAGAGSFNAESSARVIGSMAESGVDLKNPEQVMAWFADRAKSDPAIAKADLAALGPASFDALTGGLAGRFLGPALGKGLRPVLTATGKEMGLQMAGGGAGSIAGNKLVGEPIDWKDFVLEVAGEFAPGEAVSNVRANRKAQTAARGGGRPTTAGERDENAEMLRNVERTFNTRPDAPTSDLRPPTSAPAANRFIFDDHGKELVYTGVTADQAKELAFRQNPGATFVRAETISRTEQPQAGSPAGTPTALPTAEAAATQPTGTASGITTVGDHFSPDQGTTKNVPAAIVAPSRETVPGATGTVTPPEQSIEYAPWETEGGASVPASEREDGSVDYPYSQTAVPIEPQTTTELAPDGRKVVAVEMPVNQIEVDPVLVPQFKNDADETSGEVRGEELKGDTYQRPSNPIVVWQLRNGRNVVVTGRHRFALAKRLGEQTIPATIVREADGFTRQHAITLDAEFNIRDGNGSVDDYANYLENTPQLTEPEARARGLLDRAKGQAAWHLARSASDDLKALYKAGRIKESRAVAIAAAAPGNAAAQAIGSKFALAGKSAAFIRNVIQASQAEAGQRATSLDLFGNDDAAMQQMAAQAERASQFQKEISEQVRAVQGAAKRPDVARKLGVDVQDPAGVANKIVELKNELARWQNWPLHPDLVAKAKGLPPGAQMSLAQDLDKKINRLTEKRDGGTRLSVDEEAQLRRLEAQRGQQDLPMSQADGREQQVRRAAELRGQAAELFRRADVEQQRGFNSVHRQEEYLKGAAAYRAEANRLVTLADKLDGGVREEVMLPESKAETSSPQLTLFSVNSPAAPTSAVADVRAIADTEAGDAPVRVVHDATLTHNGQMVEGYLDPATGQIVLNAAAPTMRDPANVRRVVREERAHWLLTTPEGQAELRKFTGQMTPAQRAELQRQGYTRMKGESASDYEARLHNEFIAKQARENTAWWRKLVERVREWLAANGLAKLTNEEAARAILRRLNAAQAERQLAHGYLRASNGVLTAPWARVKDILASITAHHGTPHKVERFTTAKIGTGEGAQVYGWGLYFAENENVAFDYRDKLTNRSAVPIKVDGNLVDWKKLNEDEQHVYSRLLDVGAQELRTRLERDARQGDLRARPYAKIQLKILTKWEKAGLDVGRRGNHYTVSLNVEPEDLLDWDKPLSEQSEKVKAALQKTWKSELADRFNRHPEFSGAQVVNQIANAVDVTGYSERAASEHLSKLGIRGIRYLDQGSRRELRIISAAESVSGRWAVIENGNVIGRYATQAEAQARLQQEQSKQTYNYVIFDENDITITHENGQPVSAGQLVPNFSLAPVTPTITQVKTDNLSGALLAGVMAWNKTGDYAAVLKAHTDAMVASGLKPDEWMKHNSSEAALIELLKASLGSAFYLPNVPGNVSEPLKTQLAVIENQSGNVNEHGLAPTLATSPELRSKFRDMMGTVSGKIHYYGGAALLRAKRGIDLTASYQASAVSKQSDALLNQLFSSAYQAASGFKLPQWMKVGAWANRTRAFKKRLLHVAARLNATGRNPDGSFKFDDFKVRSGNMTVGAFKAGGHNVGDTFIQIDPTTKIQETFEIGPFVMTPDGRSGHQLYRSMSGQTQAELYRTMQESFPELTWLLDMFIDPALADVRQTINGIEIPVFNRFAQAAMMAEADPNFTPLTGYTPDVLVSRSLIGAIRGALSFSQGTRSPGRKYKFGTSRESGHVRDLLTGFNVRTFQMLQEKARREWRMAVIQSAQAIPAGARVEDDGKVYINGQLYGYRLQTGVNKLWDAVKTFRNWSSPVDASGNPLFPETQKRLTDDGSPEFKALMAEAHRMKDKNLMIPAPLLEALTNRLAVQAEHGALYKLAMYLTGKPGVANAAEVANKVLKYGVRNSTQLFLVASKAVMNNVVTNIQFETEAATRYALSGLFKLDANDIRAARYILSGIFTNRFAGIRRLTGFRADTDYMRTIDGVLNDQVFADSTSLADVKVRWGNSVMDYLRQGEIGSAAIQAIYYGNVDLRSHQRVAFAFLKAQAVTNAKRADLKGKALKQAVERYLANPPKDDVIRATAISHFEILNYADSPEILNRLADNDYGKLVMPFPRFGYHYVTKQLKRMSAAKVFLGKVPKGQRADAFADLVTVGIYGLGGSGAIALALMSALGGDEDDEDARKYFGASRVPVVNPDGSVTYKPIERELITASRTDISAWARAMGLDTDNEDDFWLRTRSYPVVAMAGITAIAYSDAKKHGAKAAAWGFGGAAKDFAMDFFSVGAAVKIPAKIWVDVGSDQNNRTFFDPYAQGVPLSFYITEQLTDSFIPGSRQADELIAWINPVRPRRTASKTLDYSPGVVESLESSHWTGLLNNLVRGGESGLPPAGQIDRRTASVPVPSVITPAERWSSLGGFNVKLINRLEYETTVEKAMEARR